jgi:hypothetical protein
MGAYIYALKSPKHTVDIKIDGVVHKAGILKYSHKPTWNFFDGEPRWQILANARIQRMHNLWQGKQIPRYVVVGYEGGSPKNLGVLDWHSNGVTNAVSTYDDPNWGGRKYVGRLNEDYTVNPNIY